MTDAKQALQKKTNAEPAKEKSIKDLITIMKPQIEKALPDVITAERFTRMALTAVSNNPKLQNCSSQSFLGAMMNAAQLGLEPNTPLGQAYLIPYGNQCQFQIGYKGLIDLAHRSGEFKSIYAHAVHENDEFDFSLGLDAKLEHKPKLTNRGEVIAYYAVYRLTNDGYAFEIMSKDDVIAHAQTYSKSYKNGPWQTAFDEMAKKTVLKKLLKYAPIKTEFVRKVSEDESVKKFDKDTVDMSEVNNEVETIDISVNQVDFETGEVLSEVGEQ